MDGIPIATWTPIGALCLVLATPYLLMARGLLVNHKALDDLRASYERQLEDAHHDRDEWRAAHRISETARQIATDQVDELLEHARTTDQFIRSLERPKREAH